MDSLATTFDTRISAIGEITEIDEAIAYIRQLSALKEVLISVGRFHDNAILYAKLEAAALVRAVELGGANKLRGDQRKAAEWLFSLAPGEREKFIEMCSEGMTISSVYKREVKDPQKFAKSMDEIDILRGDVVEGLKEDGVVNIEWFSNKVRDTLQDKPRLANDIIDGLRSSIRSVGGVGVGENGTYVLPGKVPAEEIIKAVKLRYESISKDLESIREICSKSGISIDYRALESSFGFQHINGKKTYVPHVLLALSRLGVFSNSEELTLALEENETKYEIDAIAKDLRIARAKVLENLYEHRFDETEEK